VFELELEEKLRSVSPSSQTSLFSTSESSLPAVTATQSSLYLNHRFKYQQQLLQHSSVMNLYESILDVVHDSGSGLVTSTSIPAILSHKPNQPSCPFTDSGIHSEDSLYSCVQAVSEDTRHLEQGELPLGWIKCCDDEGVYYWHKPSGTVTRRPPATASRGVQARQQNLPQVPKKNFNIDEYSSFEQITELINGSSSILAEANALSSSSSASNASSEEASYNYEEQPHADSCASVVSLCGESVAVQRFYVRSLGWVRIDENDLTPERSSKAVNRCINELSRGRGDLNDVVASWGEGKDVCMDLEDSHLVLVDTSSGQVLNRQSITSIRVWGVGRDNGR